MPDIDAEKLQENWSVVAAHGDDTVAHWFYSHLFLHRPDARPLFAPSMTAQRDRLVGALGHIVSNVDKVDELVPFLQDLGRDHRKFGAVAAHYPAVGESLLATLEHFSSDVWTTELADQWGAAYGVVAQVMVAAADEAAKSQPPFWEAEVTHVDRRTFDIAVLRLATGEPYPYRAGQSCAIEVTDRRPRLWRWYTPANAPGSTELEFHVRLLPGGPVSTTLVRSADVGDSVRLGSPFGRLTLDPESIRPVLLIAGSTGLAPMKALIAQLARDGGQRRTALYFGARTVREVYDGRALDELNAAHDWLSVTTAVSDDPGWHGAQGLVGEVALDAQDWTGHDVYVCGSPAMVDGTLKLVAAHGVPREHVRYDEFGESN